MRELDVLLERYLRERYPSAPAAEQQAFAALLDLPDPQLLDFSCGGRFRPIRTGFMSSRNSPTLTLDVRARRAERRRGAGSCSSLPAARSWLLGAAPSWIRLFAAGGRRRRWVRVVARRLDRVQASDRWSWLPTVAGAGRSSVPTARARRTPSGRMLWLRWTTQCRSQTLDAAGPRRSACRAAACAVRAPADRGSGAGVARSPGRDENGSRTRVSDARENVQ